MLIAVRFIDQGPSSFQGRAILIVKSDAGLLCGNSPTLDINRITRGELPPILQRLAMQRFIPLGLRLRVKLMKGWLWCLLLWGLEGCRSTSLGVLSLSPFSLYREFLAQFYDKLIG